MTDRNFLRMIAGLVLLVVAIAIGLLIGWYFEIPYQSIELWSGVAIAAAALYTMFITPLHWKPVVIGSWVVVIAAYYYQVFNWTLWESVGASLLTILVMVSSYFAF